MSCDRLVRSCEHVDELAPPRFLRESEVLVQRPYGLEINVGRHVGRVNADAVQPSRLARIAAVLHYERPLFSSAAGGWAFGDDMGVDEEIAQACCGLDHAHVLAVADQIQAQVSD